VALNGLDASDIRVELIVLPSTVDGRREPEHAPFVLREKRASDATWTLSFRPEWCGGIDYRIRVFPSRPDLVHPLETGLLLWL
jgi:starch phosphorylase